MLKGAKRGSSQEIREIGSRGRGPISAVSVVGFFAILLAADQWLKGNTQFAIIVGLIGGGLIYSGMSD